MNCAIKHSTTAYLKNGTDFMAFRLYKFCLENCKNLLPRLKLSILPTSHRYLTTYTFAGQHVFLGINAKIITLPKQQCLKLYKQNKTLHTEFTNLSKR